MRAEIGIVVAQVRGEAVNTDIFGTVRAPDRDKLPLFAMHQERIFKCARAKEFHKFHAMAFPFRALDLKGQSSAQVTADDVETGMGPVFAFADFRVRWTFTGFDGLELRDDEEPKGEKAKGKENEGLKGEGEDFAFHGISGIQC